MFSKLGIIVYFANRLIIKLDVYRSSKNCDCQVVRLKILKTAGVDQLELHVGFTKKTHILSPLFP